MHLSCRQTRCCQTDLIWLDCCADIRICGRLSLTLHPISHLTRYLVSQIHFTKPMNGWWESVPNFPWSPELSFGLFFYMGMLKILLQLISFKFHFYCKSLYYMLVLVLSKCSEILIMTDIDQYACWTFQNQIRITEVAVSSQWPYKRQ